MYTEALGIAIFLTGVGVFSITMGIVVSAGKMKSWWLLWDTPITPIAVFHIMIPGGIAFIIMGMAFLLPDIVGRRRAFGYGLLLLFISYILVFWQPRWLIPKWLLWLEDHHGEIYDQLREEAQKMGAREWEKRVSTQEGLEVWAMEVRRKYGWDHPNAGSPYR
jgi:hypothetical protein